MHTIPSPRRFIVITCVESYGVTLCPSRHPGIFVNLAVDAPLARKPITPRVVPSLRLAYSSHKLTQQTSGRAKHLQGLQAFDSSLARYCASYERQYRRPSLPESRNPADAAGKQPARENATSIVHDNWIYRT